VSVGERFSVLRQERIWWVMDRDREENRQALIWYRERAKVEALARELNAAVASGAGHWLVRGR